MNVSVCIYMRVCVRYRDRERRRDVIFVGVGVDFCSLGYLGLFGRV